MLIILYLKTMKNILEEIDYWLDKGGKEGLYNAWMLRTRLVKTLRDLKEREEGISPLTHPEEEYQERLKECNLSKEELLRLIETGNYSN